MIGNSPESVGLLEKPENPGDILGLSEENVQLQGYCKNSRLNPTASSCQEKYSRYFDLNANGIVEHSEFAALSDGSTARIDDPTKRARAAIEAAEEQARLNNRANEMYQEAVDIAENSAGIPPNAIEAGELARADRDAANLDDTYEIALGNVNTEVNQAIHSIALG